MLQELEVCRSFLTGPASASRAGMPSGSKEKKKERKEDCALQRE